MKKAVLLALGIMVAWGSCAAEPGAQVLFGPYVQRVETEQATVMWISRGEQVTLSGEGKTVEREEYQPHLVRFAGLTPDTAYTYTLKNGLKGSFRTAPAHWKDFRFLVYGDCRGREEDHAAVVAALEKEKDYSFVIQTGDMVRNGKNLDNWKSFFRVAGPLMAKTWYVACPGNHERNASEFYDFFDLPGQKEFYSFNWAGVHFATVNTEPPEVQDGMSPIEETDLLQSRLLWNYFARERAWLDHDLAQNANSRFLVVFMHVPYYDSKVSRREPQLEVRKAFADIIDKHKVELVLWGHTHNYQHYRKGMRHFVVSGGGGAPLYDIGETAAAKGVETVAQEKTFHYCVIDVKGPMMYFQAKRPDGSVIDSFSIESQSGPRTVNLRLKTIGKNIAAPWEKNPMPELSAREEK